MRRRGAVGKTSEGWVVALGDLHVPVRPDELLAALTPKRIRHPLGDRPKLFVAQGRLGRREELALLEPNVVPQTSAKTRDRGLRIRIRGLPREIRELFVVAARALHQFASTCSKQPGQKELFLHLKVGQ
jgi:hypothetical protein